MRKMKYMILSTGGFDFPFYYGLFRFVKPKQSHEHLLAQVHPYDVETNENTVFTKYFGFSLFGSSSKRKPLPVGRSLAL